MNNFLQYILSSTLCLTVSYLFFRILMRNEPLFSVNRRLILLIVFTSAIFPLVQLPVLLFPPIGPDPSPPFLGTRLMDASISPEGTGSTGNRLNYLVILTGAGYFLGLVITLLLLVRKLRLVLSVSGKVRAVQMDGFLIKIVDRDIPSFAFGRSVVISQEDYLAFGEAILAHEKAHIHLNHFRDLILLELVRIFHWFNPMVYRLISDMKEIHEFQADRQTLHSGVDAAQYQLLIIQKGVGSERFALANSFNHCQIKKRMVMMNNLKTSKVWRWKVAAFLPVLAFLLMAFSEKGENPSTVQKPPAVSGTAASQFMVKGTVTSTPDGKPLPNVAVLIKGKTDGTITDSSGKYLIKLDNDSEELVFSLPGRSVVAVKANKPVIDVVMKRSDDPAVRKEVQAVPAKVSDADLRVEVKGHVSDVNGKPLPFAAVIIKGTTIGTITDQNGNYLIRIPDEKSVLVFALPGFTKTEVAVNGQGELNVQLKAEQK